MQPNVALYVMFDQSASMNCVIEAGPSSFSASDCTGENSRLTLLTQAMDTFFRDAESTGMEAGIGFFGYMFPGETSCSPTDYDDPSVPLGALPENADILGAILNAILPTGETPTPAAIAGACSYLRAFHAQNASFRPVLLLVTDGVPEAPATNNCDPNLEEAAQAAAVCLEGTPRIETHVLGVGQGLDLLHALAAAGGTDQAYVIDGSEEPVSEAILDALRAIRSAAMDG